MVEVEYKGDGPVALVSLNAPERLNALSPQMRDDLGSALDAFEASADARVAILRGNGRSFCVGFNMSRTARGTYQDADAGVWSDRQRLERYADMFLRLWDWQEADHRPGPRSLHGRSRPARHVLRPGYRKRGLQDRVAEASHRRRLDRTNVLAAGRTTPRQTDVDDRRERDLRDGGSGVGVREPGCAGHLSLEQVVDGLARDMAKVPASLLELKKAAINRGLGSSRLSGHRANRGVGRPCP